jgi:hypothetical protein
MTLKRGVLYSRSSNGTEYAERLLVTCQAWQHATSCFLPAFRQQSGKITYAHARRCMGHTTLLRRSCNTWQSVSESICSAQGLLAGASELRPMLRQYPALDSGTRSLHKFIWLARFLGLVLSGGKFLLASCLSIHVSPLCHGHRGPPAPSPC